MILRKVLRKIPLINKMMINWAERSKRLKTVKQLRTYWTPMTQYRVEPKKNFVESEDEQEQQDNRMQAVTMLREDDSDEAKEEARRTKVRAEPNVHDILQGMPRPTQ